MGSKRSKTLLRRGVATDSTTFTKQASWVPLHLKLFVQTFQPHPSDKLYPEFIKYK